MSEAKYVSSEALAAYTQALSEKLGRKLANVYTIKGSAIYADVNYLASPISASIDSIGLWHQVEGNWVKITEFAPGWVYNILNSFNTDSNFIDASNKPVAESSNIVVVNTGTEAIPVLKFDAIAIGTTGGGTSVDLSDYDTSSEVTSKINTAIASIDMSDKQDKELSVEPDIVVPDLTYADAATRTADTTTNVSDKMIAFQEDTEEYYYAEVMNTTIIWHDIGNTRTVEGVIKLIGSIIPVKPISTAEIQAMFA